MRVTGFGSILGRIDSLLKGNPSLALEGMDPILPRKGPITRTMSKRLQEDWARAAEEGPRVLMNLRVDF